MSESVWAAVIDLESGVVDVTSAPIMIKNPLTGKFRAYGPTDDEDGKSVLGVFTSISQAAAIKIARRKRRMWVIGKAAGLRDWELTQLLKVT